MIYGIKFVMKYMLGRDIAGRNLAVYPGDTFLVDVGEADVNPGIRHIGDEETDPGVAGPGE